jgi:hypothetical protein
LLRALPWHLTTDDLYGRATNFIFVFVLLDLLWRLTTNGLYGRVIGLFFYFFDKNSDLDQDLNFIDFS